MNVIQEIVIGIVVTIIVGLCIWGFIEHMEITDLHQQVATADAEKSACDAANVNWKTQADSQNQQIAQMTLDEQQREASAAKAVAAAKASSTQENAAATSILTQNVDSDDCKGAQQVLSTYLKGHSK